MRTALFVYEPTSLNIVTEESGLELACMDADSIPLVDGNNTPSIRPGIYKIVSNRDVQVSGNLAAYDIVVTTQNKTNDPVPPARAQTLVAPVSGTALHAFFAVPEAKQLANP